VPVKHFAGETLATIDGPVAAPAAYVLAAKESFQPNVVTATFDGSGAAAAFLPCCSIYSQDGKLISRTFPAQVAVGDVAEVTYGPFLPSPSGAAPSPAAPTAGGFTVYSTDGYVSTILHDPALLAYWRLIEAAGVTFHDTSGIPAADDLTFTAVGAGLRYQYLPPPIGIGTAATNAMGALTSTGATPADGDTVTLGTQTYIFRAVLTGAANEVASGGSAANALANLQAAINLSGVAGVTYAASMTKNVAASSTSLGFPVMGVTAATPGSAGNAVASTRVSTALSWGAAALTGGKDATDGAEPVVALTTPNPANAFDGGTGRFARPAVGKIVNTLPEWSLECWFQPWASQPPLGSGLDALYMGPIFSSYPAGGNNLAQGWLVAMDYLTANYMQLRVAGGSSPRYAPDFLITTKPLAANLWYHLVITVDTTGWLTLYLNGEVAASGQWIALNTNFLRLIGGEQLTDAGGIGPYWRSFVGLLGEVAVYNKALTSGDVIAHYIANGTAHYGTVATLSGAAIADGTITTAKLADKSVTTPKLNDLAVTAAKIANATITATQVAAANRDGLAAVASMRTLGTGAQQAMGGQDVRLFGFHSVAFGANVTPDAALGWWQQIVATGGAAFTITSPSNPPGATATQELVIEVGNGTAGALGAITWQNAYVFTNGAFVAPAAGKLRHVVFGWNGAHWIETSRALADY
jgi:hypothetical protein